MSMNLLPITGWLMTLLLLGAACGTAIAPTQEAERICQCLRPVDSLNQQLVVMLDQGQQEEAMEIMMDLDQLNQQVADCLEDGLPEDMSAWPSEGLKTELDRQCPQWETIMHALSGYPE